MGCGNSPAVASRRRGAQTPTAAAWRPCSRGEARREIGTRRRPARRWKGAWDPVRRWSWPVDGSVAGTGGRSGGARRGGMGGGETRTRRPLATQTSPISSSVCCCAWPRPAGTYDHGLLPPRRSSRSQEFPPTFRSDPSHETLACTLPFQHAESIKFHSTRFAQRGSLPVYDSTSDARDGTCISLDSSPLLRYCSPPRVPPPKSHLSPPPSRSPSCALCSTQSSPSRQLPRRWTRASSQRPRRPCPRRCRVRAGSNDARASSPRE